MIQLQV